MQMSEQQLCGQGPAFLGRQGREGGGEKKESKDSSPAPAHRSAALSPKCSPRAKQCPRLSYNPSFNVGGNVLDFSGVGVTVVPEVPRGRTPSPVQFSL